jgi:vancomycin resistance protein VanJ
MSRRRYMFITMPVGNSSPVITDGGGIHNPSATALNSPKRNKWWNWLATIAAACTWLYVAAVLAVWLLLHWGGDRWWFATMMLFGPRWFYAIPLVALVPAAILMRPRLLWPLGGAFIVLLWPIMGLCLPWARLFPRDSTTIRVLTCNVKGKCNNNETLEKLINTVEPDIVALQGCWGDIRISWPEGWHVYQEEEHLIASRFPVIPSGADPHWREPGHWPRVSMVHCTVQMSNREIDFCSVHLLSPREGLVAVIDRQTVLRPSKSPTLVAELEQRSQQSEEAARWAGRFSSSLILAGDFNMPTDSIIYRRDWAGYRNSFSDAGLGFGHTEWRKIRSLPLGIRIDHVLSGSSWRCCSCWVGPDVDSDHLPLIADLQWTESTAVESPPDT